MSSALKSDIHDILSDANIPWGELRGSAALVTGATGLIGGLLVRVLSAANIEHSLGIRLVAHGRDIKKGESLAQDTGAEFVGGDIRSPLDIGAIGIKPDYIFHCAAITNSADMLAKPVDVIATEIDGSRNMLELAKKSHCKGLVYLSSMEVYGQAEKKEVGEADLGYLDLSSPRSSYPGAKRICEALCAAYAAQHGVPAKIARLARTFGAGAPNDMGDGRVACQFARRALAGQDIELHTQGNSIANCCYTADAIRGLITILLKGKIGEAYNVANPAASATVRRMAEIVANDVCHGKIKVAFAAPEDLEQRGYAPDVGFALNADKLKALGWAPARGLKEMYERMLADWRGDVTI